MTQIPAGTKFIGIKSTYPTSEKKSALANSYSEIYTIEDIVNMVVPTDAGTAGDFGSPILIDGTTCELNGEIGTIWLDTSGLAANTGGHVILSNNKILANSRILLTISYDGGMGFPIVACANQTNGQVMLRIFNADSINSMAFPSKLYFEILSV